MRFLVALAASAALAGRVAADLNIQLGGPLGNLTAAGVLNIADGPLKQSCADKCSPALASIASCDGNNGCLCNSTTTNNVVACEQCWFDTLIRENGPKPEPLAGSTPVLTAYAAACSMTPSPVMALTLPPNWLGPRDIILNMGETVVVVGIGGLLGVSALFLLSNI